EKLPKVSGQIPRYSRFWETFRGERFRSAPGGRGGSEFRSLLAGFQAACPQLYKYDSEKKLVPLQGDEIGRLVANALEGGIVDRRPWYEPADKLPDHPIISVPFQTDFDSLVVEMPARNSSTSGS